ncbi:NAD(P)-dependent alcohol dehydrogenase [Pseudonocardia pini]|uniref:NAD(P)-dependent alcohol dehydrogenase n=1 Tax=Pseudonocardia pini TaxID=2758030 RepID=UPI0015F0BAEB|nr:NAD(P)-dependent alcohol dehydrogenase [Pseudonocardia pini]
MKAIRQDRYGGPEVLALSEVPDPVPGPGEVLVRVHAASVNAADWHILRGDPYLARLVAPAVFGRHGPRSPVGGHDVAGVVEALGPGATRFAVGDAVLGDVGDGGGAFAELVSVGESLLVPKPASLSFEQAAALPLAGTTALLLLRSAEVREGSSVLIVGASGGVGTYAVQLAAAWGAEVTAVCSARNMEQARALGATHVVDRTRTGLPAERYDSVVDLAGRYRLRDLLRRTAPEGVLVLSGGGISEGGSLVGPMGLMIAGRLAGLRGRPRVAVPTARAGDGLAEVVALAAAGTLRPVIERTVALAEVAAAIEHMEREHTRGKLVVTVQA